MPLKVGRFCTSFFVFLTVLTAAASAQTTQPSPATTATNPSPAPQQTAPAVKPPTAAEVMRDRISRAKAYIAVRNYNAAIYELEGIRRESADPSVHSVVNVLLMNSYLEQGDYKRAQDFLNQAYAASKANKPGASPAYFAIAGQVVKGARNRVERYRALGLNVSDRTLPLEAINDLEKMRETVELVVTQSKDVAQERTKTPEAMALLEEATNSRSLMARDSFDARRWQTEIGDAREQLANSRSVVLSAVNDAASPASTNTAAAGSPTVSAERPLNNSALGPPQQQQQPVFVPNSPATANTGVAANQPAANRTPPATDPAAERDRVVPGGNQSPGERAPATVAGGGRDTGSNAASPTSASSPAQRNAPAAVAGTPSPAGQPPVAAGGGGGPRDDSPLQVGSLVAYATKQTPPVYPVAARSIRATGLVRVDVMIDENGQVAAIERASGPVILQDAAKDAIRKWRFKPFQRDGQPVKATGFVNFNFSL